VQLCLIAEDSERQDSGAGMSTTESAQRLILIPPAAGSLSKEQGTQPDIVSQDRAATDVARFAQEDVDRSVEPMMLAGFSTISHIARLALWTSGSKP
jgi:hypothetical protein